MRLQLSGRCASPSVPVYSPLFVFAFRTLFAALTRPLCRRARVSRNRHAHDDGEAHRPDRAPPRGAGRDMQRPAAGLLRGGAGDVHGTAGGRGSSARGGRGGFSPEGRDRAALRIRYEGRPDRAIRVLRGGEGLLRGYTDHGEATVRERHPSEGMRWFRWE